MRQELIHSFFFLSSAPSTSSFFLPASKLSCFGICLSFKLIYDHPTVRGRKREINSRITRYGNICSCHCWSYRLNNLSQVGPVLSSRDKVLTYFKNYLPNLLNFLKPVPSPGIRTKAFSPLYFNSQSSNPSRSSFLHTRQSPP